jgi:hypothetical protein
MQTMYSRISRLLVRFNIRTMYILTKKSADFFKPMKDDLGITVASMYCVPCECSKMYDG